MGTGPIQDSGVINSSHFPIKHTFYVRVSFTQEWVCVDLIFLYLNKLLKAQNAAVWLENLHL